ncbi:hypothetical protein GCM10010172_46220 [Paractinoplanes ferrugineus]|uniref:Uncharacterized protein n=1 Tax=Paractinoplanes ferrugineus TaxID=113564 RepID=A0A919J961_9ACTN|nr:hypothetical protein Afe05nite_76940 [Actinoplanes ferrugineus]
MGCGPAGGARHVAGVSDAVIADMFSHDAQSEWSVRLVHLAIMAALRLARPGNTAVSTRPTADSAGPVRHPLLPPIALGTWPAVTLRTPNCSGGRAVMPS